MISYAQEALRLPPDFDEAADEAEESLATFLCQPGQPAEGLQAKLESIREASFRFLERRQGKPFFDGQSPAPPPLLIRILRGDVFPFGGPIFGRRSLVYLPQNANSIDYGTLPSLFPDNQRYAFEATFPSDGSNRASRRDGQQFCFVRINNFAVSQSQSAEASIGFFYNPSNRLSTIEVRPEVDWSGAFRSLIELSALGGGGSIEIFAQLTISLWQQIPGGIDLLRTQRFNVGTSGRRDATMNNPRRSEPFQQIPSQKPSALFQVEGSRTYLIAVTSRLTINSRLFLSNPPSIPSEEQLSVYAHMASSVSSVRVTRTQINLF